MIIYLQDIIAILVAHIMNTNLSYIYVILVRHCKSVNNGAKRRHGWLSSPSDGSDDKLMVQQINVGVLRSLHHLPAF